jgi:hypothetical protein
MIDSTQVIQAVGHFADTNKTIIGIVLFIAGWMLPNESLKRLGRLVKAIVFRVGGQNLEDKVEAFAEGLNDNESSKK